MRQIGRLTGDFENLNEDCENLAVVDISSGPLTERSNGMVRPACDGLVPSLQGHLVMLTGKTRIGGEHVERGRLTPRLEARGAEVLQDGTRNRRVTLLVLGDLVPERVTDPINVRSKKVVFVDNERERGNHICMVDDGGISDLLQGQPTVCLESRNFAIDVIELRRATAPSLFGPKLRLRATPLHEPTGLDLDMGHLDRASAVHERLINALRSFLAPIELKPPGFRAPPFDAGWADPNDSERVFIAEVKSLTGANEEQQIRLGIGQVLDYCHTLRAMQFEAVSGVTPVLVLEREPKDPRWLGLANSLSMILTYPPDFPQIALGLPSEVEGQ